MKKNDTIYTLQQNIEIPDIVTEKANMAFEQIRKDAGSSSDKIVTYQKPVKKSHLFIRLGIVYFDKFRL